MTITNERILSDIQKLAPDNLLYFFDLDATNLGASQIIHFTNHTNYGASIKFGTVEYLPLEFNLEKIHKTLNEQPELSIEIGNVENTIGSMVYSFNDLCGAKLTIRKTFRKYLDTYTGEIGQNEFEREVYIIDQKLIHNKVGIKFKLISLLEFKSQNKIPSRQMIRDVCPFIYRYYTSSAFVYDHVVGCPYTGSSYFDEEGNSTANPALDKCGKTLDDCKLRFYTDSNSKIPFGGFKGMVKYRIS